MANLIVSGFDESSGQFKAAVNGDSLLPASAFGALQPFSETIVGSATTTQTVSSLDLDSDTYYYVNYSIIYAGPDGSTVRLYVRPNAATTNQESHVIVDAGTPQTPTGIEMGLLNTQATGRNHYHLNGTFSVQGSSTNGMNFSGRSESLSWNDDSTTVNINQTLNVGVWTTTTNLTSLDFVIQSTTGGGGTTVTNGIGAGSVFRIYKLLTGF